MLEDDVISFLGGRPIAMLCTRDRANRPSAHECFLAEITAERVVALVPEQLARNLAENVADNGEAAMVVSRAPGDHRSVQLKGKITRLDDVRPRPEDFAGVQSLAEPIFSGLMPDDAARAMVEAIARSPVFRIQLDVRQVFDQTPGPGAGRRIGGGDA